GQPTAGLSGTATTQPHRHAENGIGSEAILVIAGVPAATVAAPRHETAAGAPTAAGVSRRPAVGRNMQERLALGGLRAGAARGAVARHVEQSTDRELAGCDD